MKDFKVMLAKPFVKKRTQFPVLVSPKLDGVRGVFYKDMFFTRNKKRLMGLSHLEAILRPLGHCFDGELMVPGIPFQTSCGQIRSFNDVPDCEFHIFDLPQVDIPQLERIELLTHLSTEFLGTQVKVVPHYQANCIDEVDMFYAKCRRQGYEGLMVKNILGHYVNTRSAAWQKIKNVDTHDVKCIGFFEGQGRLVGTLGGIIVDYNQVPVRVGSGFSDEDRHEIWNNQEKYHNAMCEIKSQEETPDGSLRHPTFVVWRFDLDTAS